MFCPKQYAFPRTQRAVAHSIADAFGTACGGKRKIIAAVALIEPRAFLIVFNRRQLHYFAGIGNHVLVEPDSVEIGVAPVHVRLSVIVDKHGRINIIPVFLLPHQRPAYRIRERAEGRIGHQDAYAVSVDRTIHIPFAVSRHHTDSPGAVVPVEPFEVVERCDDSTVLPVDHIGRGTQQPRPRRGWCKDKPYRCIPPASGRRCTWSG